MIPTNCITERLPEEIYQSLLNEASKNSRGYLGMSGIGSNCLRKVWYRFRNYEERNGNPRAVEDHDGRKYLIFEMGNRVEDMLVDAINKAGYLVTGSQMSFEDFNGLFRGHCDGIFKDTYTGEQYVLEIKSANKNRFEKFEKNGVKKMAPEYWAQLHLYMHYSKIYQGLFMILNKDNSDLYLEKVEYDSKEVAKQKARAIEVLCASEAPERISEKENSKDCYFCGFKYLCFGGEWNVQTKPDCRTCKYLEVGQLRFDCGYHKKQIKRIPGKCDKWVFE